MFPTKAELEAAHNLGGVTATAEPPPPPAETPLAPPAPPPDDFARAVELMRLIHENNARVMALEGEMNQHVALVLSDSGADAALLEGLIADATAELEKIARANPHWFENIKRIKTPYGNFQLQKSTSLIVPDEAGTIRKIRRAGLGKALLRLKLEVKLEVCEQLDDDSLARLGIVRKREENFSVKPLEVKAGKAAATFKAKAKAKGQPAAKPEGESAAS